MSEPGAQEIAPGGESGGDRQLGEFRLLRRLGAGGMAEVWLAEQTSLKRHVALKLLRRELTADTTYVLRFESEAKSAAGLNHPNIVQIYTVGQIDGQHYIAQEYVQGQTLKTHLQRKGPLAANVALHVMRQTAAALVAAADRKIVHRDIKPENIMLTRKGDVKVADFGLAQVTQGEELHLTQEGVTMGTPLYMSPEQVKGKKLDQRSDIYSFGITCYHMLAGRTPFTGESAVAVAVQHLQDEAEPLRVIRPDLPPALCDVVQRMMAKDPGARYPDARALLGDIRKITKALKETGSANDVVLADFAPVAHGGRQAAAAPWRPRAAVLVAMCFVLGLAGAAIGWTQRTPNLLEIPVNDDHRGARAATAHEQYIEALFSDRPEEAFLAVRDLAGDDDQLWNIRATEQLALLYLRSPNRAEDAQRELDLLKTFNDARSEAEAALGEAALAAYANDYPRARTLLERSRNQFEELAGSWRELYDELQRQLENARRIPSPSVAPGDTQPQPPTNP